MMCICGENLQISSFLRIKRKILGGIVAITHIFNFELDAISPARHASVLLAPPLTGVRRGSRAGTVSLTRSLTSGSLMVRALAAAWRDSLLKNKKRWDDDRLLWSLRRSSPLSVSAGARAGPPDSRSAYHASLLLAPPWRGHRGGRVF